MTKDRCRLPLLCLALLASVFAAMIPVGGCHTVQGVGQDISSMGETGQKWIDGDPGHAKK